MFVLVDPLIGGHQVDRRQYSSTEQRVRDLALHLELGLCWLELLQYGGDGFSGLLTQPLEPRNLRLLQRRSHRIHVRRKAARDMSIRSKLTMRKFYRLVIGIVRVPGKNDRLEIQRAEFLIVQTRRFVGRGQVVAPTLCRNQQCCHSGFIWSQHAQLDSTASEPRNILIALKQQPIEPFAAQPVHYLIMFGLKLCIPGFFRYDRVAIDNQAFANSGTHRVIFLCANPLCKQGSI